MGYNVWDAMAQWTEDTFSFMAPKENQIYSEESDPREVLRDYGVTEDVLPNWLPDGYQYTGINIAENPIRRSFKLTYLSNDSEIGMTIVLLDAAPIRIYEKDSQDITVYTVNGIDHYIIKNIETINIIWITGNCECSISGYISVEDAQNMIDSIYRS